MIHREPDGSPLKNTELVGLYKLPNETDVETPCEAHQISPAVIAEKAAEVPAAAVNFMMSTDVENMVPERFDGFVPWGHFRDIKNIIKSKIFYPIFVTGLSGNGKTLNVYCRVPS